MMSGLNSAPERLDLPVFSLAELRVYDSSNERTYLGCNRLVFDVSSSPFYKEGGSYSQLAGHDASVALARMDLSAASLSLSLSDVELTEEQQGSLETWEKFFVGKGYSVVGRLSQ
jgi:predicted heme/steroid binding protein